MKEIRVRTGNNDQVNKDDAGKGHVFLPDAGPHIAIINIDVGYCLATFGIDFTREFFEFEFWD